MPQAVNDLSSRPPMPSSRNCLLVTRRTTGNADDLSRVVALDDYRHPRAATSLEDARSQLDRFLPDFPLLDGLSDIQVASRLIDFYRLCMPVYSAIVGGKRGRWRCPL